jgi:hypothetical protein
MGVKIQEITSKSAKIASTDLIEIAQVSGPSYVSRKVTGAEINELSLDTTPQLGGNLDVNGNSIVSTSNGNIKLTPNGTGAVIINIPINQQAVTTYTLALTDASKMVEINSGLAATVTIPTNTSVPFPTGTQILISGISGGVITIAGAVGVTIFSSGGKTKLAAQYSIATLIKRATDGWYLAGDLTT